MNQVKVIRLRNSNMDKNCFILCLKTFVYFLYQNWTKLCNFQLNFSSIFQKCPLCEVSQTNV